MLAPDVDIQDGKGTILISSEEGETDCECDIPSSGRSPKRGSVALYF